MNFLRNVLTGTVGLLGVLVALFIATVLGAALWFILTTLGVVVIGFGKFLLYCVSFGLLLFGTLYLIGAVINGTHK